MDLPLPVCVALAVMPPTSALFPARAEETRRPKDAAEAVQEGNVKNWVEYYERTREAQRTPAKPSSAAPEAGSPKDLPPAPAPR